MKREPLLTAVKVILLVVAVVFTTHEIMELVYWIGEQKAAEKRLDELSKEKAEGVEKAIKSFNKVKEAGEESAAPPASIINRPTASAANRQLLDQRLFNVVGEAESKSTPDDARAALDTIGAGANVNARNSLGDTPLLIATRNGRVNVLKALLDRGADVNARNGRGETALMLAVGNVGTGDVDEANDVKAVRLLIAKGADVNVKDDSGFTILSGSEMPGGSDDPNYLAVRRMLKRAGAK